VPPLISFKNGKKQFGADTVAINKYIVTAV
jgi:hypothetical protein